MKKRLMLFLGSLFLCLGMAYAQIQVKGTIISADDGEPLPGASVKVVGTKSGTTTNLDGQFTITVANNDARLELSHIGMVTRIVKARNGMRIALDTENFGLDEVIVQAFGTAKKSAFTGSASVIKADDIAKVQTTNALDALKGKATGVQITQSSGQPGTAPTIRIRGIGSIRATSSPLYIVDGAPFDGDINTIAPNDIESMTVLKEAAAAALYGARAANGVIIITTRSGRTAGSSNSQITVDAKWGSNSRQVPDYNYISSPAGYYETWYKGLFNYAKATYSYTDAQANAFANQHLTSNDTYGLGYNVYTVPEGQSMIGMNGKLNPNAKLGNIVTNPATGEKFMITPDDWVDNTYRNALREEYTVTATGSTDKSSYYASFNYLNMNGITVGSDYERLAGRIKADYQIKPWLKVGMNANYTHYDMNNVSGDGDAGSSGNMFSMTRIAPIYPLYIRDAQGNILKHEASGIQAFDYGDPRQYHGLSRPFMQLANPLSDTYVNANKTNGNTFNGTGSIDVTLPYGFRLSSNNNVYVDEYRGQNSTNPWFGSYASYNGMIDVSHGRTFSYNLQQLLNWHQTYGQHDIEAMVGHEYYRRRIYSLAGHNKNMFDPSILELSAAVNTNSISTSNVQDYNTEGFFARAQYNYAERYFAQASFRRDGSSYFHPDNRWGNFWSVGGAWLLNKENWFDVSWIDELKVKASYGEQGNDRIGYYNYITTYSIDNSNGALALSPLQLGNKSISWEKSGEFNAGIEFALFKNRLRGGIEYYYRKTSDMLSWFSLPASFGFTGYYDNVGDMRNSGVEIELEGDVFRTHDFTWTLRANLTSNSNKILTIADENKTMHVDGIDGYQSNGYFYGEGKPIYTWYMYKYAGVDKETGEALYYKNIYKQQQSMDADGKPVVNTNGEPVMENVLDEKGNPIVDHVETTKSTSDASQYLCDDANPKAFGGFGTSLTWKGFDLNIDFTYQLGGKVYDTTYASSMNLSRGAAIHADILDAWTPSNTGSDIPRMNFNDRYMSATSDRFLTSGSYLNVQNITLGYTLPKSILEPIHLTNVRVYVSGDNIWLFSKRKGLDPRQSLSGSISNQWYSPIRSISGGISVTF